MDGAKGLMRWWEGFLSSFFGLLDGNLCSGVIG